MLLETVGAQKTLSPVNLWATYQVLHCRGRLLALPFITVNDKVVDNSTLIPGDMGAETASEEAVCRAFQWAAYLLQACISIAGVCH